jgi:hypothetical protein
MLCTRLVIYKEQKLNGLLFFVSFWYFWLTIQNTTDRHVSNAFDLLAVFISFSIARTQKQD